MGRQRHNIKEMLTRSSRGTFQFGYFHLLASLRRLQGKEARRVCKEGGIEEVCISKMECPVPFKRQFEATATTVMANGERWIHMSGLEEANILLLSVQYLQRMS